MGKRKPAIRFKGFEGEWDKYILHSVMKDFIVPMRDKPKEFSGKIPWTRIEDIEGRYINGSLSGQYVSEDTVKKMNLKIIPKDSLIVSASATFGVVAIVTKSLITNQTFIGLVPKDGFNLDYLYSLFQSSNILEYMKAQSAGSTIFYISRESFENMPGNIPQYAEQNKVGCFFNQLDTLITQQKRKYDTLLTVKKSMLEKMFPKNGADVPEIRFKGFSEVWKKRTLFLCLNKIIDFRGRTPKKLGMNWSPYGYLALSALNVKNGYIDKERDAHYGNQELYDVWMKGNELHKGQVLFTTEAPMGNVAQIPDNHRYILSQRTIAFEVNEELITENFLATILSTPSLFNRLSNLSSGGTAKGVSQKSLSEIDFLIPTATEEQDQISFSFKKLDSLIFLHRQKLNHLKHIKSALLEKMFVQEAV